MFVYDIIKIYVVGGRINMKLVRRFLSYILVFMLCILSISSSIVYASWDAPKSADELVIEGFYVNPLTPNVISKEELKQSVKTENDNKTSFKGNKAKVYTSVVDVGDELRKQMTRHKKTVMINYRSTKKISNAFIYSVYDEAFKETGKSTEGDYLKYQCACYGEGNGYQSGKYYNFTLVFYIKYYTTLSQEEKVTEKVKQLKKELHLTEDQFSSEKVKSIYDYICSHVTYDYSHLDDETYLLQYTAYAALIEKSAVCQGYAVLLYRLAEECGLDVCVIGGTGNGGPHAWNIMRIGKWYYNLDSTWDAGETDYAYFLKGSEQFQDHESDDEYLTTPFQSQHPISMTDYQNCPSHNMTEEITKATTRKDGYILSKCSICNDEYSKKVIASPKTVSASDVIYNGKNQCPKVVVKDTKGRKIEEDHYTVAYTKNKNVGKASVTVALKGNRYSGNLKGNFIIQPKGISFASIKAKSKGFTTKWKKQKTQTSGYQIQYSTNNNFKLSKTITVSKNSIVTKNVTKLKAKKRYYIRIRTYKKVGNTKYYSKWSGVKTVKTKK